MFFFIVLDVSSHREWQNYGGPTPPPPEPHQWSNFIGGTLNTVSREHNSHYMFRTTPYMDMETLHKHNRHLDGRVERVACTSCRLVFFLGGGAREREKKSVASIELRQLHRLLFVEDLDVCVFCVLCFV